MESTKLVVYTNLSGLPGLIAVSFAARSGRISGKTHQADTCASHADAETAVLVNKDAGSSG